MGSNYSYATSFPSPILTAAAFDDPLVRAIGEVVGREGRAFGNGGFAGFDYWVGCARMAVDEHSADGYAGT